MVDMLTRIDIINLTRKLVDKYNISVIMITHEMNLALHASAITIILFKGAIVEQEHTKKILENHLIGVIALLKRWVLEKYKNRG